MELLGALGQHARVIRLASQVLELKDPELRTPEVEQEALYRMAVAQRFSGQDRDALETHRRLTQDYPLNPYRAESVLEQGLIYMKLGDAGRGVPLLLDAVERENLGKSSRLSALRILAQHDQDTAKPERALKLRMKMQDLAGPEVFTSEEDLWIGQRLIEQGEAKQALGYLARVEQAGSDTQKQHAQLLTGRAQRLLGDYDKAIQSLNEVRAVSEHYGVEAWLEIALVYRDSGKPDQALGELAALQNPDRGHRIASQALYEAGLIHRRLYEDAVRRSDPVSARNNAELARKAFKKLWLLYPDREGENLSKRAYLELAELQHDTDESSDEIKRLEELVESYPDSPYTTYAKAILAIRADRPERADTYLRQTKEQAGSDDELKARADRLLRRDR